MTTTLNPEQGTAPMPLLDRARAAAAEWDAEDAAENARREEEARARMQGHLVSALKDFGITVDAESVRFVDEDPVLDCEGLRFAFRCPNLFDCDGGEHEFAQLVVACPCTKNCDAVVWVGVEDLVDLARVIDGGQRHRWDCTDEASQAPAPTPFAQEHAAIDEVLDAAETYGQALAAVQALEDERPLIKAKCIAEMIGTPNPLGKPGAVHSASSAEAIVEENARYWQHRQKQATAEVERWKAHGQLEAAKLRARLAVATVQGGSDA